MNKQSVAIPVLLACLSFLVIEVKGHNPGYETIAVYGSSPSIDGMVDAYEWSDASSIFFNNTEVYIKQDGVNLYVGFNVSDFTCSVLDGLAIYWDVENDGSMYLQPDDIAFVTGRNGILSEANVTAGNWVFTAVSGWTAQVFNTSDLWQAELNITYAKVNVTAGVEKTIGAAFGRSDNGMYPFTWPFAENLVLSPATWGDITSTGHNWIPEFTSMIILPLVILTTLLTVVLRRRERKVFRTMRARACRIFALMKDAFYLLSGLFARKINLNKALAFLCFLTMSARAKRSGSCIRN